MGGPPGGSMVELIQNPYHHNELYTVTKQGRLYRSENKGDNWQLINGLENINVNLIALSENRLFICSNNVIYYLDRNDNLFRLLDSVWSKISVSDGKLYISRTGQTTEDMRIEYADLDSDVLIWKDITPTSFELHDLVIPSSEVKLNRSIEITNIISEGDRILAGIMVSVEGSGELSNGYLYTSEDLGQTWKKVELDVPKGVIVANVIQDSANSKHIIVLFRHPIQMEINYPISNLIRASYDGGITWNHVINDSTPSNGITDIAYDGSVYYLVNAYNDYILKVDGTVCEKIDMPRLEGFQDVRTKLSRLFFDLDDPNIVYGGDLLGSLGVAKSEDHMKTWRKMDGDIVASSPTIVLTHPTDPNIIFTDGNVIQEKYLTLDGGKTWKPFSPTYKDDEIAVDPYNPKHILLIDETSLLYESFDYGQTWQRIDTGFSSAKVLALAIAPDKIYVSNLGLGISEYMGQNNWHYLMNSPDYAYDIVLDPDDSNILYASYSPKKFENFSSVWRYSKYQSENFGWSEILRIDNCKGITSLKFDPSDSKTIYAGTIGEGGTIYVSHDKGNTWSKLNQDLNFTTIWGQSQLQIDPRDKNMVYAGTWGGGIYKTADGGKNWQLLDINQLFSPTCIAISETNPDIVYACDRTKALIHRSDDAGKTWYTYYDFGQEYMLSSTVSIDPNNPDIIYASAFKPPLAHRGAFVKIVNGKKVADLGTDLPRSVLDIEIDKKNTSILYVTTHIYGTFKSVDGGNTFQRLDDQGTGLPRTGIYHIEIDPANENILYATALSGALPDYMIPYPDFPNLEGQCGVYKSTDGGENWSLVLPTASEARGISIDPQNNNNLYVADMMGGVWVSNDAGQTWRQENTGLGSISMTSVKIKDGNIYASTQGSGVYAGVINKDNSITWDASRSNKPKAYVSKIQIRVDPRNSNRIYASGYPGGLLRSDDGGKHWNDKNFLTPSIKVDDPAMQGYYSFDISSQNTSIVWLGAYGKGMYVSYDSMDYDMVANGADNIMAGKHITDVRIDPTDANTVWAATQEGVYVTKDSGGHWEALNQGLNTLDMRSLRVETIQWPSFNDDFESGNATNWRLENGWSVIQENTNHILQGIGYSWAFAGSPDWGDYTFETRVRLNEPGSGLHINFRYNQLQETYFIGFYEQELSLCKTYNHWTESTRLVNEVEVHNLNQWYNVKVVAKGNDIKVYVDGFLKIDYIDPASILHGAIAFEAMNNSRIYIDDVHITIDQGDIQIYAGTAGYGIYKLDSLSKEWQNLGRTIGTGWWSPWERRMYQFSSLLFDPDVKGRVYLGHFPGGFSISDDSSHNWVDSSLGLGNDGIFSLTMHPYDHKILFAGTYNGVMKSVDGGHIWETKSNGMPPEQWPYTVAIDSQSPNIMYTSTKNGHNKGFAWRNDFNGVVMKSTDGGESWFKIMNGLDEKTEFYTLIIYPLNHDILFLSTNRGVYVSQDAGNTWQSANNGLPSTNNQVRDNVAQNLALTPDNRYLILGLLDYGVWKADISEFMPSS
jgi:photosystem II stability/assembly factor-like uncharacterized protein